MTKNRSLRDRGAFGPPLGLRPIHPPVSQGGFAPLTTPQSDSLPPEASPPPVASPLIPRTLLRSLRHQSWGGFTPPNPPDLFIAELRSAVGVPFGDRGEGAKAPSCPSLVTPSLPPSSGPLKGALLSRSFGRSSVGSIHPPPPSFLAPSLPPRPRSGAPSGPPPSSSSVVRSLVSRGGDFVPPHTPPVELAPSGGFASSGRESD